MILLTTALIITIYSLQQLWVSHSVISTTETLLFLCNISSGLLLVFAATYNIKISRALSHSPTDNEDTFFDFFERKYYRIPNSIITALVIAFISTVIGFIFLREEHPQLVLTSFIIGIVSLLLSMSDSKMTSIIFPNYSPPVPNTKEPVLDSLNIYDDGQKYVLLKSLYKLYFLIIFLLVLLIFGLMYYSVLSGNNQTVSIIGIGVILLISLTIFTSSLKPQKTIKK
ncbi:hypothetical protein SSIL_1927 [Solibacillus silvestris StLB046]|uniref:Uncharacterized protein n=1 Tax=Solibacillus silvestris (strain StLB046) TaxID=1002809 RepID=F2F0V6_SOLSS|nr:hypothetical protein [Solibacillus silvestris]BAK16350.1 hypothetical protein SSIL_1927 [Solibacillus silvestris StLB046]